MAGYRDWSQGASSSAAPSFPIPAPIPDPEELEFMSQGPSRARAAPSLSAGRVNMQDLDLNSQDESFPYLDEYTDILESGRGRGDGVRIGSFQPPRQTDGGVPIARGRAGTARGGRRGRGRRRTASPSPPSDASPPIRQHLRGRLGRGAASAAYSASMNTEDVEQLDEESGEDHHVDLFDYVDDWFQKRKRIRREFVALGAFLGMYYYATHLNRSEYRVPTESGYEWVIKTLGNRTSCHNMFRMNRNVFDRLHNVLVQSYGLKSTRRMTSVESLALFLWMCGAPQSMRQAEDRFVRSTCTISRKFNKVLHSICKLAGDIIRPVDPTFSTVHPKLRSARFSPYFDNCIGAIDGTHVPVVVPADKAVQHTGRHGYTSQNVLAICDFDMRFTFVVAGWPGSVHDMRVFKDALDKYGDKFPHPPEGKFYLVDSGYANRIGYLAPYKGTKYHLPEFRAGRIPRGKKEHFNYAHSSLRNVIERSFGVLKNKWRILRDLPSYPMAKQSQIIIACMAIHNFIRESAIGDVDFDNADDEENDATPSEGPSSQANEGATQHEYEDQSMNQFRDWIADGLFNRS
ncbi:uncharacterized protein LOC101754593 isoform X1 [Setaria italica]|uniref:uncharacterized protein LOC101781701 isoform X1 n=3 Tax=Setaria italica TaxID=4555 RepID=UPI000350A94E|nr:uncharacterized protein LOC101781701 isoform X1 [Setaria italica]XP_004966093.1 uncharacterized protein LOC101754593 isoform X1 [Setaria italica]